jgi:hypothetical protein
MTVEPEWRELTTMGSTYEEEFDVRANPSAPDHIRWRHRQRSFTGEYQREWAPGRAPTPPDIPLRATRLDPALAASYKERDIYKEFAMKEGEGVQLQGFKRRKRPFWRWALFDVLCLAALGFGIVGFLAYGLGYLSGRLFH